MQSSSKVIVKILIDYDEYLKLKSYEKEIKNLNAKKTQDLKLVKETEPEVSVAESSEQHSKQVGAGFEFSKSCLEELATTVSNHLAQQFNLAALQQLLPASQVSQKGEGNSSSNDLLPPCPSEAEHDISQPAASDFIKQKSQQFDKFDINKLINSVPQAYKQRAKSLTSHFQQCPLEIDFDANGLLILDGTSIPNSNIFKIFPELFIKKLKKPLPGKNELVTKIASKGWGNLIVKGIARGLKRPRNYKLHSETESSLKEFKNWWYMSV